MGNAATSKRGDSAENGKYQFEACYCEGFPSKIGSTVLECLRMFRRKKRSKYFGGLGKFATKTPDN